MALHQSAGIVAGSSTAGSTTLSPLATSITGRKKCHRLCEILLHLVEHIIVCTVLAIETIQRRIVGIISNQRRILIISCQCIV